MPPPGPITGGVLSQILQTALVQNTPIAISGAGTTNISVARAFMLCFQRITIAAGSYTANLTLDPTNAVQGSIIELDIELAGSSTAIIPIYSQSVSGSPIESVNGRADARYYYFRGRFNGTDYEKLFGAFQL